MSEGPTILLIAFLVLLAVSGWWLFLEQLKVTVSALEEANQQRRFARTAMQQAQRLATELRNRPQFPGDQWKEAL